MVFKCRLRAAIPTWFAASLEKEKKCGSELLDVLLHYFHNYILHVLFYAHENTDY